MITISLKNWRANHSRSETWWRLLPSASRQIRSEGPKNTTSRMSVKAAHCCWCSASCLVLPIGSIG